MAKKPKGKVNKKAKNSNYSYKKELSPREEKALARKRAREEKELQKGVEERRKQIEAKVRELERKEEARKKEEERYRKIRERQRAKELQEQARENEAREREEFARLEEQRVREEKYRQEKEAREKEEKARLEAEAKAKKEAEELEREEEAKKEAALTARALEKLRREKAEAKFKEEEKKKQEIAEALEKEKEEKAQEKAREKQDKLEKKRAIKLAGAKVKDIEKTKEDKVEDGQMSEKKKALIQAREEKRKLKEDQARARLLNDKINPLENMMAFGISRLDNRIDIICWYVERFFINLFRKIHIIRENIYRNRMTLYKDGAIVVLTAAFILVAFTSVTDYQYAYNGKVLGIVREQTDVTDILELVSDELAKEYNSNIKINPEKNISFKPILSINKDIDDQDTVLKKLSNMGEIQTQAYQIIVDGEQVVIVESEEIANEILMLVQNKYLNDDDLYEYIGFVEEVTIEEIGVQLSEIVNKDDAVNYISKGRVQAQEYTVVSGDTLYGIAEKNGITYQELKELNPKITNNMVIHAGDKFVVQKDVPLLTVKTIGISTFAEAVPYSTEYQQSSAYYVGESITTKAGKDGKQSVTATLTMENGVIVGREDISTHIIIEPVTRIIVQGSKPTPPKQGTGTFKYPSTLGYISSYYGMRNGRMHKGIDLAVGVGTNVRASDGGTVTMAKWYGDYGYCVMIDHGGGYSTLYGHNSKIKVSVGEKVYQGQIIALSGNTGRSTGPHIHFEILYLGKNVNPIKYLTK